MTSPTRIRATVRDGIVDVRVLMTHEMETGQRPGDDGKLVPAWFIREVAVTHNGNTVMSAQWGPAISKNPYLQFRFRGGAAGDKIDVKWTDNRGESRSDSAAIA
jgi:sulfur-oxidizing protein SoxZ